MKCLCSQLRKGSRQLGHDVITSILKGGWEFAKHDGLVTLKKGLWCVSLTRGTFPLFDRVLVRWDGTALWLPLLTRLRLRKAIRFTALKWVQGVEL